ncbi:CMP-sialic acid transporter 3 [Zea mays]|uniref:CMP-sialic acid transporter 3 n=1 Tax=Zea mays TaxID=4577 RepID=A0A1D6Q4G4_MAIZE|nr:CMP-sialic acid transporter 3 [Zea mays]
MAWSLAVGGCSRDLSEAAGTEQRLGGGVACIAVGVPRCNGTGWWNAACAAPGWWCRAPGACPGRTTSTATRCRPSSGRSTSSSSSATASLLHYANVSLCLSSPS